MNIQWLTELKFYEVLILIHSRVKGYYMDTIILSNVLCQFKLYIPFFEKCGTKIRIKLQNSKH